MKKILLLFLFIVQVHIALFGQSSVPVTDFWRFNSTVEKIKEDQTHIYVAGAFTRIYRPNKEVYLANCGVLYDTVAAGNTIPDMPSVLGTRARAVVSDNAGGWFVAGQFTSVNGVAFNNIVHIKADGTVDLSFKANANNTIHALYLAGNELLVGGEFTVIQGASRNRVAKINALTGDVVASFDPNVNGIVYAFEVNGNDVWVGGAFTQVGTFTRNNIAKISLSTGAVDAGFNANVNNEVATIKLGFNSLYIGGTFTQVNATSRNRAANLNAATGALGSWNPNVGNNRVSSITFGSNSVYLGGTFTTVAATTRNRIAKVSSSTGTLLTWNPNAGNSVTQLHMVGNRLLVVGGFTTIASVSRTRAAMLDTSSASATAWSPVVSTGAIYAAASASGKIYLAADQATMGSGKVVGGLVRFNKTTLALDENWMPIVSGNVLDLFIDNNDVYIGGTFLSVSGTSAVRLAKIPKTGNGAPDTGFTGFATGTVRAITKHNTDLIIGGEFTLVNGTARNRLAMLEASTGTLLSWNPNADNTVNAIVKTNNGIFAAGAFTTVSGITRNRLVKFTLSYSTDLLWNVDCNQTVLGLNSYNNQLYLTGDFTSVNSTPRTYAARVSETLNGDLDAAWAPVLELTAITSEVTGNFVYLGGINYNFNIFRHLTRYNINTGNIDSSWVPSLNNQVKTMLVSGDKLFAGGMFTAYQVSNSLERMALYECGAITPINSILTAGTVGAPYSQSLTASSLGANPTWSVVSGSLPPGISLNTTSGVLSGTPTQGGSFQFQLSASASACTVNKNYSMEIDCPDFLYSPMTISATIPVYATYSQSFTLSIPNASAVYKILNGNLPPGLVQDSITGQITGSPTSTGVYPFSIMAQISGCTFARSQVLTVNCGNPSMLPLTIPNGTVDTAYSQQLSAANFGLPASWSITSGALPAGLSLNASTGLISGTPTTPSSSTFTVLANNGQCSISRIYSNVVFCNTITLSPSSLPNGRAGTAWVHNLSQTGITGTVIWEVINGSLPPGVTLNLTSGVLGGTPTTAGTYSFTIRATGNFSCTKEITYSVTICPNASVLPVSIANSVINSAFSQQFTQSALSGTIAWSVSAGSLPPGLSLDPVTGLLSGTPSQIGLFTFTIQASNGTCTVDRNFALRICPEVTIGNLPIPVATTGVPYNHTLTQTGYTGTVTWTMSNFLGLNITSGGTLTGTPTSATTGSFVVNISDGNCSFTSPLIPIVICNPVTINPTTLSNTTVGATYNQSLTASGVAGPYTWSVTSGSLPLGITLNSSTGVLSGNANSSGNYAFTIGVSAGGNNCPGSRSYTINVNCGTTSIAPTTLANGNLGTPYSVQLIANGLSPTGTTWTVASGNLPAGLTLNSSTGEISGTPTTAGASAFTIAANGGGCSASQTLSITICPSISVSPTSVTQCAGTSATFNVTVSGTGPFTYQWKSGSNTISGATNASLTLSNLLAADAGYYTVDVTSSCGTSSSTAIAVVVNPLTTIITQPSAQALCVGANASFTVAANGTGSLSYQWKKAGNNIAGATNSTYTINNIAASDAANYSVEVTGTCGTIASNAVALTLNTPTSITTQPTALVQCAGTNASFSVVAAGTGTLSYQWKKGGNAISGATNAAYTINNINATDAGNFTVDVIGLCGTLTSNSVSLTVNPVTAITTQPVAVTQCAGTNATFWVVGTGTGTLTYQWKKAGSNIAGATNASFTINSISTADAANYSVEVSSTCGSLNSNGVALTVQPATTITTQPVASTTCVGGSVTFSVTAFGQGTLTYQWKKGGSNISTATNSTYTINNVSIADAGNFSVEVVGACGTVLSNAVALTVNTSTAINVQPAPIVQCAGTNATFSVSAAGAGTLTYQWKKAGNNITGATNSSLTLNAITAVDAANYSVEVSSQCGTTLSNTASLTVNPITVISIQPQSQALCAGANATFSVSATGTGALTYQWKKGGSNILGATNASLTINSIAASDAADYTVEVSSTCGTVTSSIAALTLNQATTITTQPLALTQCAGTNASFSVVANGSGTLTYQWKKVGNNISGATNSTLILNTISAIDVANYSVDVTALCGTVVSSNASLTVNSITTITTQPSALTQCSNTNAIFIVLATGTGTLSYQWRKAGINITGATNASLTLNNIVSADAANYSVVVTGTCGSITSANAALIVNPLTTITSQPQATTQCLGANATFTVSATGTGAISYQWKKGGVNIPSATNSNLTLSNLVPGDAANYTVEVTASCGTVTSNNATLSLNNPVNITTQPSALTQCAGTNALFNVSATGTGTLSYQWRKAGINIPGATNASLTLNNINASDAALYAVNVNNVCGTLTSANANLTINPITTITTQPSAQALCVGLNANFSVVAAGTGSLTYQWRKDGNNIVGANNANLTIGPLAVVDAGNYTVVVTGDCGTVTSQAAVLTINQPVSISMQGQPQSITQCEGTNATFTVNATGTGALTYQWQKAGMNIPGATQTTLALNAISFADAGNYTVLVTNTCNANTSAAAQLVVNPLTQVTIQPQSAIICEGSTLMLSGSAIGTGTITYQWQKDGINIQSETNDTLVINAIQISDIGAYQFIATGLCGIIASDTAVVNLNSIFNLNDQAVICSGSQFIFGSQILTAAGVYTETFQSINGCDSVVTLTLTVNPTFNNNDNAQICDGDVYVFGTQNLTTTGVYTEVFNSITGCDSTVVLALTVVDIDVVINVNQNTLSVPNVTGVTYQWIDCNSNTAIAGATNAEYTANENGRYQVEVSFNGCQASSDCIEITGISVEDLEIGGIRAYPNPTRNFLQISGTFNLTGISLINQFGVVVYDVKVEGNNQEISIGHLPGGVYHLQVVFGNKRHNERIVIQ